MSHLDRQVPRLDWVDEAGASHSLTQSISIIEVLNEAFAPLTGRSLLPHDIVQRARARQIAEIFNSGTQPLQNVSIIKSIQQAEVVDGDSPDPVAEPGAKRSRTVDGRGFGAAAISKGLAAVEALVRENSEHEEPEAKEARCGRTSG